MIFCVVNLLFLFSLKVKVYSCFYFNFVSDRESYCYKYCTSLIRARGDASTHPPMQVTTTTTPHYSIGTRLLTSGLIVFSNWLGLVSKSHDGTAHHRHEQSVGERAATRQIQY
jgi:hypothetical protein